MYAAQRHSQAALIPCVKPGTAENVCPADNAWDPGDRETYIIASITDTGCKHCDTCDMSCNLTSSKMYEWKWVNGVLVPNSALQAHIGMGSTKAHEMNFGLNHAPGARSNAQPIGSVAQHATTVPWLSSVSGRAICMIFLNKFTRMHLYSSLFQLHINSHNIYKHYICMCVLCSVVSKLYDKYNCKDHIESMHLLLLSFIDNAHEYFNWEYWQWSLL